MAIADLAITSLETITAFGASDGKYLFTLDELQNATMSQSQESTDITGKAGRKLSTLKRNKTFTISASNGLISTGLLAAQTGGIVKDEATLVNWSEEIVSDDGDDATLTYAAAIAHDGDNYIKHIFVKNADGTLGDELLPYQAASGSDPETGDYEYNDQTKVFTFHNDVQNPKVTGGSELFVIYDRMVEASQLIVDDDISDVKAEIFVDAIAEDKCAKQYRVQLHIPKADISAEFSLDMGDNQAIHSFEAQALAGKCGASGNFWEWTVFGATADDYEVAAGG